MTTRRQFMMSVPAAAAAFALADNFVLMRAPRARNKSTPCRDIFIPAAKHRQSSRWRY